MRLTDKQRGIISDCFLFQKMDVQEKAQLLDKLTVVSFVPGQEIYTASCFQKSIGILTYGRAVVRKGREVELNTLYAGDCFGAAGLFHPTQEYVTTIVAKTTVEIVFISDKQLTDLFAQYPQTAINYIAFLSRRIYFLNHKIDSFTAPTTEAGLCMYLLENQQEGIVHISGGCSHLARQLNMGRASLYRSLDQLEKRGVIHRKEKTIVILNIDYLRNMKQEGVSL
ncbi:Crp/Fnr family transcriptional regulator [Oscillospiraceae bacterium PP1C4]